MKCDRCGRLLLEAEVRFDIAGKVSCEKCFAKGMESLADSLARRLKRDQRRRGAKHEVS